MTDERKKRRPPISYRPPKDREEEFYALVAESGLPANAFITERIFGGRRRSLAVLKLLGLLLAKAARISDQLHELALAGAGDSALLLEAIYRELVDIRAALLKLMGRKP